MRRSDPTFWARRVDYPQVRQVAGSINALKMVAFYYNAAVITIPIDTVIPANEPF